MKEIVKILMIRDNLSKQEAIDLIKETKEEMLEAMNAGESQDAEDIFTENLNLEPDYIMDIF